MDATNGTYALLRESKKELLNFLKARYSLYHLSNVFFRDIQYGVSAFLEWKSRKPRYSEAEALAQRLVADWVAEGILEMISTQAFVLKYPEFKKPSTKPAVPAKPAPAASQSAKTAAPAQKPAGQDAPAMAGT
ncbi:MAG: hypothetical protein HBSIN02_09630 [Bacteroidia bacterium]|nr:MAG: hypothetical protein HBSIN02_09630 [Bacteroidia bacterium]